MAALTRRQYPKRELLYHRHYATRDEATLDIFEYIEVFL
ncbi:MAG TPA: IS3 family transposase [Nitrospira sp.]|nr:IS3 family transposase [Nitrospira sp.]